MSASPDTIVIPPWANGPGRPGSGTGNGGWTAGLLARHAGEEPHGVVVNLRMPPPLGRPLTMADGDVGQTLLLDAADRDGADAAVVASAAPSTVEVEVPAAVRRIDPAAAARASTGFPFRDRHPFPHCVSCGIDRDDELPWLRVHCGPVPGLHAPSESGDPVPVFADEWTPSTDLADHGDPSVASVEACWSALDCPSAAPFAEPDSPHASVLARIAVRIDRRPRTGESHVLAAWRLGTEGRKQRSASTLLDGDGGVLAVAEALWIRVPAR